MESLTRAMTNTLLQALGLRLMINGLRMTLKLRMPLTHFLQGLALQQIVKLGMLQQILKNISLEKIIL